MSRGKPSPVNEPRRERSRWFDRRYRTKILLIDRRDLIPLDKGRALDRSKVAEIAASMVTDGWQGLPLLGVWSGPGPHVRPVRDRRYLIHLREAIHLMTGSHRLAAARKAKMRSIPVYLIETSAHGWTIGNDGVVDAFGCGLCWCDDYERELAIHGIEDPGANELMAAEAANNELEASRALGIDKVRDPRRDTWQV